MDRALLAAVVGITSAGLGALLVPPVAALARRLGILDPPGSRKIHGQPMPRLGGVAVFATFALVVIGGYTLAPSLDGLPWVHARFGDAVAPLREAYRVEAKLLAVLGGAALAFGVGLCDDLWGSRFPAWAKAAGQIAAALVLVAADVRTSFLPYDWMNSILTVVWLFGVTNAFNLLDNMDGLSAGVAFVASAVLLINAWSLGEFFISLILVAFMGSLLGFLFFNFHPARIFLGDCGSLFIGYLMGSLTLLERYVSHASGTLFPVLMPVVVLAVPIVDTASVVVIRMREGRPVYVGDRRHLSHRLLALGFSQRGAALVLYLTTFSLGLGAASLTDASLGQSLLILLQSFGFVALLLVLLFHERRGTP
jgi:UDP-GlcNAc:undecaprenyl-phosphate/decaprenyl-phosphate GlcNAc-1-phosphate transferase